MFGGFFFDLREDVGCVIGLFLKLGESVFCWEGLKIFILFLGGVGEVFVGWKCFLVFNCLCFCLLVVGNVFFWVGVEELILIGFKFLNVREFILWCIFYVGGCLCIL